MKKNEIIHGFRLDREEEIREVGGTARIFTHVQTGAVLIYISNSDDNKVFQIGFKTPSGDSTGVAHIMEHSVLCGSKKYPVKEPFVELAKGSLNTFLNAMTYPDKTVYPIASTNEKDFMNLMDVYLDAVFNPAIYDSPRTFMQEGWHYHIENPEDPITYNGVVYNEMKGVYSSPEEILHYELFKALYPDTIYSGESGGHPDCIPHLSYEDFKAFHQTFYHPSNAYIYLYGDGDVEAHLKYLDEEYLSKYKKQVVDNHIPTQPPFKEMVRTEALYPIAAEEEGADKDYLAIGFVMDAATAFDDLLAMDILGHILLGHNGAPLKKALLQLDICKEVDYSFASSMKQPYFAIVLKNTDKSQGNLFVKTVRETLEALVKEGLNPRDVEAGINSAEFTLKEGEFGTYPRGLMYGLEMMETWLYGCDPLSHLKYTEVVERLRQSSLNRGFEGMISRYLLMNEHQALVAITPDPELSERNEQAMARELAELKASLNEEELGRLVKASQDLLEHQNAEDSPEALATIPKLGIDEIKSEARKIVLEEETYEGVPLLWHPGETNGIVYIKLIFDIHSIPQEDLKYLSVLNKFLSHLGTADYTEDALNQEIEIYTGGIATSIETFDSTKGLGEYAAKFTIKGKATAPNVPKLMALMENISLATRFDDYKLMSDIIGEIRMSKEQRFLTAGHVISTQRLQSYYSQSARLFEEIGGIEFYHFLAELDDHFKAEAQGLSAKLSTIMEQLFNRTQVTISLTCEEKHKDQALKAVGTYLGALRDAPAELYDYHFPVAIQNEGFKTAAKVQYVSKGFNIRSLGYDYSGSMLVLKSVLSMDYLWNKVRVQGGAYGASFGVNKSGELYFASYRDPNIGKTFDAYNGAWEYIASLDISNREMEKYIIGTISGRDTPLSAALWADACDTMYFNQTGQEDLQQERDEILATTKEELRHFSEMVKSAMDEEILCVIGGEEMVEANAQYFNEVKYIK
ncbi:MAG: insulinase family protein [Eubacterium aggregans]|uniref:insulinase family protein n=1 Tax=Eubacterium aggregans TaxID=81409 RepID=UPI002B201060|nr:insulinase family protein [Eubacterium aggregans]MEA5074539.1 insulinase family protein [Eubacterium aggregans]